MVIVDARRRIVEYLEKQGPTNTFRLSRELGIDRHKLLNIVKELEEKRAIGVRHGNVKFLKSPAEEKKVAKVKETLPKPKAKKTIQKKARDRGEINLLLRNLEDKNKELREKVLGLEASIKRQSNIKNKFRYQVERIEQLEKTIKELQRKANIPPKIIRRTIIKKIPIKVKKKQPKKFKLPKLPLALPKKIKQLKIPKITKWKIKIRKPKINFSKLNKKIKQLHVPEIFGK